jgi:hypothetical protein
MLGALQDKVKDTSVLLTLVKVDGGPGAEK